MDRTHKGNVNWGRNTNRTVNSTCPSLPLTPSLLPHISCTPAGNASSSPPSHTHTPALVKRRQGEIHCAELLKSRQRRERRVVLWRESDRLFDLFRYWYQNYKSPMSQRVEVFGEMPESAAEEVERLCRRSEGVAQWDKAEEGRKS
jgi:hypothetical protein